MDSRSIRWVPVSAYCVLCRPCWWEVARGSRCWNSLISFTRAEEGRSQERILTSVACHGSIRAGKKLSMEEMRELVRQLEQSETVGNCPHGRPSVIHVSGDLLAKSFRRR